MALVGVPVIDEEVDPEVTEPTSEAPGDDTQVFPDDDVDEPDEPDLTEEATQDNRLFVPSVLR